MCVCKLAVGTKVEKIGKEKRKCLKDAGVEPGRKRGPRARQRGRSVVCMLYSFINYTDFKAALFYNAGLL